MQENSITASPNANIIDQAQFEADKRAVYKWVCYMYFILFVSAIFVDWIVILRWWIRHKYLRDLHILAVKLQNYHAINYYLTTLSYLLVVDHCICNCFSFSIAMQRTKSLLSAG